MSIKAGVIAGLVGGVVGLLCMRFRALRIFFWRLLLFIFSLFLCGFLWFIWQTQRAPLDTHTKTDAIVVLTGGKDRIETGYTLLRQGLSQELFISGVSKGLDGQRLTQLYKQHPEIKAHTHVGHEATNTRQNVQETKAWLNAHHYTHIRLVTAGYHMPRSLHIFHKKCPHITIIPHPIVPSGLQNEHLWHPGVLRLLMREYFKFLITYIVMLYRA